MRLVIAEKPMLARDIARAICGHEVSERERLPIEGNGWCVCALAGHVLRLMEPAEIDPAWAFDRNFSEDMLPISVSHWPKRPMEGKEELVESVRAMLEKCEYVVHAGDPDDEGQLLVDEVLDYLGWNGRTMRVLVNDNIAENIQRAFNAMRPNREFEAMGRAAYARQMADMCLGVSESRLATMRLRRRLTVGRVQTPTLGLVVRRDALVEGHVKRTFYGARATVSVGGECFEFEIEPSDALLAGEERVFDRGVMARAVRGLAGTEAAIEVEVGAKQKQPPLPYTLTVLQTEMSKRFGMTLDETLTATQSLRDRYKAISYNRSDCPYLPADMHDAAPEVMRTAMENLGESWTLDYTIRSRAFDDAKVGAHHGIVPQAARVPYGSLSEAERRVYRAVAGRYAMQFTGPVCYDEATALFTCRAGVFKHVARYTIDPGYTAVFGDGEAFLGTRGPLGRPGDVAGEIEAVEVTEGETRPPARYTEGTLAADMARAAKYVADPALAAVLREKDADKQGENGSIGTVATRAAIVEKLKAMGFIEAKGKSLVSTRLGREFYSLVPEDISGVELTAKWWLIQQEVAADRACVGAVQDSVAEVVAAHVASDAYMGKLAAGNAPVVGKCPACGADVVYLGKICKCSAAKSQRLDDGTWEDSGCAFKLFSVFCGKQLTERQMRTLLAGRTAKVGGLAWKGRTGQTAALRYDPAARQVTFAPGKAGAGKRQPRRCN